MKHILIIFSVGMLLLSSTFHFTLAASYTNVTVTEANTMIESNPTLIILDVRTQSEYDSGHIRLANHIPVDELEGRLGELNSTDEILVYCKAGGRSASASQILIDNGFLSVFNMLGGIDAWKTQGYTVYIKYSSIQEAINGASEEDTIFVSSGAYYERLIVNKTVSLVGENRLSTVIDGNYTGTVVTIEANDVSLTEFDIRNSGYHMPSASGVFVNSSRGTSLGKNIVESFDYGYGIHILYSIGTTLTNNVVNGHHWCDMGIRIAGSNSCVISDNDISGGWALILILSYYSEITDNVVFSKGNYGIKLDMSHDNLIAYNDILNATDSTFASPWGLWSSYSSTNNTMHHNNFLNNTNQAHGHNLTNFWDNGCEGNYWSDYNGTDSDGDGIGDTSYVIDANNTDNYPLMDPYWNPGDINHDLEVNIFDVVSACSAYLSTPADVNWNCHCDIAEPYGIINIFDIVTITTSYGEEYTP